MKNLLLQIGEFEKKRKEIANFVSVGMIECIRALESSEQLIRALAPVALWYIGDRSTIAALRMAMEKETDEDAKNSMECAIGKIGELYENPTRVMLGKENLHGWVQKKSFPEALAFAIWFGDKNESRNTFMVIFNAGIVRQNTRKAIEAVRAFERGKELEGYVEKVWKKEHLELNDALCMGHMNVELVAELNSDKGDVAKIAVHRVRKAADNVKTVHWIIDEKVKELMNMRKKYLEGKTGRGWGPRGKKGEKPRLRVVKGMLRS